MQKRFCILFYLRNFFCDTLHEYTQYSTFTLSVNLIHCRDAYSSVINKKKGRLPVSKGKMHVFSWCFRFRFPGFLICWAGNKLAQLRVVGKLLTSCRIFGEKFSNPPSSTYSLSSFQKQENLFSNLNYFNPKLHNEGPTHVKRANKLQNIWRKVLKSSTYSLSTSTPFQKLKNLF